METLLPLDEAPPDHRSGYVAIVGLPNVGKSTLLNALLGRKLSIVTDKPQTTRHRILGILSEETFQLLFLDTPGILTPRYRLHEAMMHRVQEAITDADLVVLLADATFERPDITSLAYLQGRRALLVLNKMDLIRPEQALPLVSAYTALHPFEEVIPISALRGDNLDVLRQALVSRLPLAPPFYPKDMISEHPERFFVSEIIREKIFEQFRQEIPYSTQVNIVLFEEKAEGKDYIDAEIVVERPSQKGILIGKGGQALKAIGTAARRDIETFLGRAVFLKLFVKVREDWREKEAFLRSFGYR
jgi:GTP-binding protein Era